MTFKPIHKHLLIKAQVGSVPIDMRENTPLAAVEARVLLHELVDLVDMTPVTQPQAAFVTAKGNEGLTGSINLSTSHIAFHIWNETNLLMLDVYSCKNFSERNVLQYLDNIFEFVSVDAVVIDRNDLPGQQVVYIPNINRI